MAAQKGPRGFEKKQRSKKRKSRTEVSSSESSSDSESTSESEVEQKKTRKIPSTEPESEDSTPEPIPEPVKEKKKKKKVKAVTDGDVPMRDASPSLSPAPAKPVVAPSKVDEEFDTIYIRKITTELADDLDKVRSAQDFKANSIPMLIHALKQGESLFSAEEKRRVVATSKA